MGAPTFGGNLNTPRTASHGAERVYQRRWMYGDIRKTALSGDCDHGKSPLAETLFLGEVWVSEGFDGSAYESLTLHHFESPGRFWTRSPEARGAAGRLGLAALPAFGIGPPAITKGTDRPSPVAAARRLREISRS